MALIPRPAKERAPSWTPPSRAAASGSVLVEFALIALVLYLFLAATIDIGRLLLSAQIVQDAARTGARELALTAFPADPNFSFDDALADPEVRARIYDPRHLVIDVQDAIDEAGSVEAYLADLPALNRMLAPLMITDTIDQGGLGRQLLRYPGALLVDATSGELFVAIPRVLAREDGVETIDWIDPVEEIRSDGDDPSTGAFSLASEPGGLIALRINYPFQAATLSGYRQADGGPLEPNLGKVIEVGSVLLAEAPPGEPVHAEGSVGVYAGPYGLGRQLALARAVRPWRRLISGQMIMRREVYR